MDAGELLETQLLKLFSDAWRPEPTAARPARRAMRINIPLPFAREGLPQGEWRARLRSARRWLARLAATARVEREDAAQTATDARIELERKARERADRRAAAEMRRERQRLLGHLLAVADNLERALAHAEEDEALREGVRLTLRALTRQLAQERVEPMEALGQPFDPRLHEAVAVDGSQGDAVVEVLERGYTLGGELLRPARVVVGGVRGEE